MHGLEQDSSFPYSCVFVCRGDTDGREGDTDDGVSEDDYVFAK